jgi:hypothetical protein
MNNFALKIDPPKRRYIMNYEEQKCVWKFPLFTEKNSIRAAKETQVFIDRMLKLINHSTKHTTSTKILP